MPPWTVFPLFRGDLCSTKQGGTMMVSPCPYRAARCRFPPALGKAKRAF
jgi:hypothetical protein